MKKRMISVLMAVMFIIASGGTVSGVTPVDGSVWAMSSVHAVYVDGVQVDFQAFNIGGHNFFMLRDVAAALRDTPARFDVAWGGAHGAISLTTGVAYDTVGATARVFGEATTAFPGTDVVYVDGNRVNLRAYNIAGRNYFMLRDLGEALRFGVDWDNDTRSVLISTAQPVPTTPLILTLEPTPEPVPEPETVPLSEPTPAQADGEFNIITAEDWVSGVRIGWNLGNQFDARTNRGLGVNQMETAWVNTPVSRQTIDAVYMAGFNAIRIPVTWQKAIDDAYNIREDWMARVRHVVDYAVANNMYIMLNTHHDDELFRLHNKYMPESRRAVERVWEQIAVEFRDYNERLIFQGFNEPRTRYSPAEWSGGTEEERRNLNELNQLFVDTVRATGGNNAERVLVVPTYAASALAVAQMGLLVPTDSVPNRIIVSIHSYAPWLFALTTGGDAVSRWDRNNSSDTAPITNYVNRAYNTFVRQNIPVVFSEMGATNRDNLASRVAWAEFYASHAHSRGIPVFWWDNSGTGVTQIGAGGAGEAFGLFNRRTGELVFPEIVEAMLRATE